ncbi:putative Protein will die slowly [Paratrimastix pyriformis]|uniref:WDR5-like beta-propeller domain-containing protein n=1 Tax=Paratrimastix pyriformis TaxID=342808 RepID=A0ABQ8UG56_9EUKA|nr:putative Protein will die slowly [Paratrimastix pyriformis]
MAPSLHQDVCAVVVLFFKRSQLSLAADRVVNVYNIENGNLWRIIPPSQPGAGHSQGINELSWTTDNRHICTGSDDRTVRIWDVDMTKQLAVLKGHTGYVHSVAFSPQPNIIASGSYDETIRLWDTTTGTCCRVIKAHTEPVTCVSFNKDGTQLLSSSMDGLCRIWDTATGQCIKSLGDPENMEPVGHSLFSPNGKFLLASNLNSQIRLWDINGTCPKRYVGHINTQYCITSALLMPLADKFVVSGSEDGMVHVWNLQTRECVQRLRGHSAPVIAVSVHPTQPCIASASLDGTVRVWQHPDSATPVTHQVMAAADWQAPPMAPAWNVRAGIDLSHRARGRCADEAIGGLKTSNRRTFLQTLPKPQRGRNPKFASALSVELNLEGKKVIIRKLTFWDERGYLRVSKKLNSVWSAISVSLGHPTATPLRHLSGLTGVRPGALNDLITTLCLIAFTSMCNPHPYILPWPLIHPDVLLLIWPPTLACPDCWSAIDVIEVHHPPLQTSPPSFKWHRRVPFPLWTCENASFDKQEESEPPQENTNLSHNIVRVWISLPFSFLSVLLRAGHLVLCSAKSWSAVVRALSTRPQQDRVDPLSPPKLSLHVREDLVKLGLQIG